MHPVINYVCLCSTFQEEFAYFIITVQADSMKSARAQIDKRIGYTSEVEFVVHSRTPIEDDIVNDLRSDDRIGCVMVGSQECFVANKNYIIMIMNNYI